MLSVAVGRDSLQPPALLEMLDLKSAIITEDAMHIQRAASKLIIGKGGDCVLALYGNRKALYTDAKAWLENPGNAGKMLYHQKVDHGYGREETRTSTVSRDIRPLQDAYRWASPPSRQ